MLQTRVGKRTGAAALRMAVDMTKGTGKGRRAVEDQQGRGAHPRGRRAPRSRSCTRSSPGRATVIANGLAASPGAAVGKVYFTADEAADADERGEKVVLVRNETSPEDVHGMMVSRGHPHRPRRSGRHAAVVARGWGTPAIVGAESVKIDGRSVHRRRHRGERRATSSRSTAPPAGRARRDEARGGQAAGGVRRRSWSGPTRSARASSPCGPTPTPARMPRTRAGSVPKASACAAPSTCSSLPTACRSCAR